MTQNSKIILSILIGVLIVGSGAYFWQQKQKKIVSQFPEIKIEDETPPVILEDAEKVGLWQGEGFTFAYPIKLVARNNWLVPPSNEGLWMQEDVDRCEEFQTESIPPGDDPSCVIPYISVNSEITDLSLDEFIAENMSYLTVYDEQVNLGENDFTKGIVEDFEGTTIYFTKNNNLVVWFSILEIHEISNPPSDDLTKIMNTLEFE